MTAQGRLILIDGYGIIFRAYHAIKSGLATSKGELTNATFGFTSMLFEVLQRDKPDYIILAFEGGQTFRHEEFTAYKANRGEMPEDLRAQLARIREVVDALGITVYQHEGFEADDVIGTLAKQANERGLEALIITGDNDLLQLVNEHTRAVLPGAGPYARFSDARYFDTAGVITKYGFEPKYVPDYKAIVGDKSDNIPNVPSVGDKTATDLIVKYGHVENILEHLAELKPKVKAALESHKAQVIQSKRLATIVLDVPLELDIENAKAGKLDRPRIIELFRELEFNSLVKRLDSLMGAEPTTTTATPRKAAKNGQLAMFETAPAEPAQEEAKPVSTMPKDAQYSVVRTEAELAHVVSRIKETAQFAFDTETSGLDPLTADLVGVSLSPAVGEAYYIPVGHVQAVDGQKAVFEKQPNQLEWPQVREALRPLFTDPKIKIIAYHAKFDLAILHEAGLDLHTVKLNFDGMIAAQLTGSLKSGLKDLAFNRLGYEMTHIEDLIGSGKKQTTMDKISIELVTPYACADADMTLRLVEPLQAQLERDNLLDLFYKVEMPLVPILTQMELTGIRLDTSSMGEISTRLFTKLQELEKQIYELSGYPFNINSTDQLGDVLFGKLGLQGGKRTSTKKFSTSKEILENIRDEHPIVELVLEYRQLGKLKSTYVDSLPLLISSQTGRIHTSFQQIGSSTGRISSNDPNLQNIPVRSEIGREVRRAFVAANETDGRVMDESSVLFAADYSQIELRILAHLTDDPRLVEAFNTDQDVHAATASDMFGVALDAVTPDMRRLAKTVNFGIIYRLSAFGLSQRTSLTNKEASEFIHKYNERYPLIKAYLDQTPDKARESGYVQTIFGRRRYMSDLKNSNANIRQEAERQAINMPVQGTAADIIKKAMITIGDEMQAKNLKSKLLLQVHDELVFEAAESELAVLAELVKRNMESAATLNVPLKADLKVGTNWRDMQSYIR